MFSLVPRFIPSSPVDKPRVPRDDHAWKGCAARRDDVSAFAVICLLSVLFFATSCGGDDQLSVEEARDRDGSVVEVEGYLIERAGELRLCEAILESFPPQCGEP